MRKIVVCLVFVSLLTLSCVNTTIEESKDIQISNPVYNKVDVFDVINEHMELSIMIETATNADYWELRLRRDDLTKAVEYYQTNVIDKYNQFMIEEHDGIFYKYVEKFIKVAINEKEAAEILANWANMQEVYQGDKYRKLAKEKIIEVEWLLVEAMDIQTLRNLNK